MCFSIRNIVFRYIGTNQQKRFYGHLPGASSVQLPHTHSNDLADVREALHNQEQSITCAKDQMDQVLAFMEATARYLHALYVLYLLLVTLYVAVGKNYCYGS